MQEIKCYMDEFVPRPEYAKRKDQGTPFMCKHKTNLLPKSARTKIQCQDILGDRDRRPKLMRQDPLS
jgi:hypothetical protein